MGAGGTKLKFMSYNLGAADVVKNMTAEQQAAHTNPEDLYGDLYQWGRMADGHEKRTSPAIAGPVSALDGNGQPTGAAVGSFILSDSDWRTPKNDNLWGYPKTAQDPCPPGWRVPTKEEWDAVVLNNTLTWQSSPVPGRRISPDGGTTTTLFLPAAGFRFNFNGGSFIGIGTGGYYWSNTTGIEMALALQHSSTALRDRADGISIRCIAE